MVKRGYESSATSTKHWTGFLPRIQSFRTQRMSLPPFAVLTSKGFGRGLHASPLLGGLASRSPRCSDLRPPEQRASRRRVGGRVARRRLGTRLKFVYRGHRLSFP